MKGKRKGKQKGNAVLQKYMVAVGEFVKNKSGAEGAEDDAGLRSVKRKSRKELRKEKRKLKKIRMKSHYEGKKKNLPSGDGEQAVIPKKQKATGGNKKDEVKKVPKTNTKKQEKPKVAPTKTNRYQESRKKALLEANEQEDREIKKLERYLKLNKRKNKKSIPQSFVADGLDYILGALDTGTLTTGMYDSDDNMDLAKDNFKQLEVDDLEEDEKDLASDGEDLTDDEGEVVEEEEEDELPSEDDESMDAELEDENDINENEESEEVTEHVPTPAAGKYVPPHMRDAGGEQRKAELEKLKKNVKGLVNRLSEPNMSSIGGQLEALYMSRSRKDMNETLTEVLLAACVTPALMPNRLLMEHVLLVSILHHTVGLEVMMKRSSCPMIVKFHTGWMGRHSRDKIIDTITSELVCSFLKVVDTQLKSFSAEYNVMEVFQLGFKMRRSF
ncbi:nucleolar MIF4G domain-containing protein 1-like [Hippocampus comes]|uniref:nucleolar MIF4G domain-containing protein 1-like n=1 Tax=Hippocampus comes TaxID=109280 RepID=UPI00094EB615|nr:PREDICTED: nucleolar MIF4G domain-containing protein 1-like [Hippocampus comes]